MEGSELEDDDPPEDLNEATDISSAKKGPLVISHGLISKAKYLHKSKNCDIQSVTYNSKTGDYIIVDSRGITAWAKSFANDKTTRLMDFSAYQFNVIKILLYCRKFNLYFALSKDYQLKVYNLNFHEIFSVASDTNSVIHMLFNAETDNLITASRGELQFWQLGEINRQFKSDLLQPKYGLILVKTWEVADGKLISRLKLDEKLQRLYCLCEKDIWCYDMSGKLIFKTAEASPVHLSACAYSIPTHSFIVGSIDGQVNVLTTTGGNIHTFYNHIGLITEIMIHPSDDNLVITSSLDGYIKIFSLDIFEELYSVRVFDSGIEFMALRSNNLLYCASVREIDIFDLNYLYKFWGQLRYPAQRIELVKNAQKSLRLLALAEDGSVRLFAHSDGRKLCTILPPPSVDATSKILDCVHDRDYNLVYLLVKVTEVWVYTTKTDPACHLAIIDLVRDTASHTNRNSLQNSRNQTNAASLEERPNCNCIEVLQDLIDVEFMDSDGVLQTKCNFLACGMDSGQIILYNPLRNGQKDRVIQMCKDPIMKMKYYRATLTLMLLTKAKEGVFLQIFNSSLRCIASVSCSDDLTTFSLRSMTLATGFSSGHVLTLELCAAEQKSFELVKITADHQSSVQSVSFHPTLDLLCSSAKDSCLKIWSIDKTLLCDINFDSGLTTACFLNALGDILIGLQNQIFIIRHGGKLAWLEDGTVEKETVKQLESEIYESPYLKYDIKRPVSPESENMEKYLVPYQDMMFSSIGSWVVADDDAASDYISDDGGVDDMLSDGHSSYAQSDIYQSSIHSDFTDDPGSFWRLPECILSPEESVVSSDDDVDGKEIGWEETENEVMPVQKPVIDPKSKLEIMLAQSKRTSKSAKNTRFAHDATAKLKNTKIDLKRIKISQNSNGLSKNVNSKDTANVSGTVQVSKSKQGKKVAKKTNKSVAERRRAVHKQKIGTDRNPQDENLDRTKDEVQHATESPDAGYQSQASLAHDDKPDAGEEDLEPTDSGILIGSKPISLTKIAPKTVPNDIVANDLNNEDSARDEFEENETNPIAASSPSLVNSKRSSRSQTASTSFSEKLATESVKSTSDRMEKEEEIDVEQTQDVRSSSSASLSSYDSIASETLSEEESDDDLQESKGLDNQSSAKTTSMKATEHRLKRPQQEDIKVKVVPAFSQQLSLTVNADRKPQSRADQNVPLTVYSLSNRASSRSPSGRKETASPPSRAVSRRQTSARYQNDDEIEAERQSRQSLSPSRLIRIPFGQIDPRETFISSSTIKKESNKKLETVTKSPQPREEKKKGDLVNFCVSALKEKKKFLGGRNSPKRSPSANSPSHTAEDHRNNGAIEQVIIHNEASRHLTSPSSPLSMPETVKFDNRDVLQSQNECPTRSDPIAFNERQSTVVSPDVARNHSSLDEVSLSYNGNSERPSLSLHNKTNAGKNNLNDYSLYPDPPAHAKDIKRSIQHDEPVLYFGAVDDSPTAKNGLKDISQNVNGFKSMAKNSELSYDHSQVPMDIYRRAKSTLINLGHKHPKVNKSGVDNASGFDDDYLLMLKSHEERQERFRAEEMREQLTQRPDSASKVHFEQQQAPKEKQWAHRVKDVQNARHRGKNTPKFDENSVVNLQREGSKGKLIFVNIPAEEDNEDSKSISGTIPKYREETFSPVSMSSYDVEKAKHRDGQRKAHCVSTLHEKLLKRRALNASMKERQTSAKFRRDAIEQQKLARSQLKSVSPSFSLEYATEFLPEPASINDKVDVTYEYNTPVPLPCHSRKPYQGIGKKSLEARLSGQPFRYGKSIHNDANEEVIVDFIKSSIHKRKKDVVLLPRPKSSPSIPAKCNEFVLVKETNKHPVALSKFERELLTKRFSEFSLEITH